MLLAATTVNEQANPDKVLTALYLAAKTRRIAEMSKTELRKYFRDELADLIWKTAHSKGGLELDIITNAQDARIRNFRIDKVEQQTAVLSYWNVTFTNFGRGETVSFEL
jgi:hypothetical protein